MGTNAEFKRNKYYDNNNVNENNNKHNNNKCGGEMLGMTLQNGKCVQLVRMKNKKW